MQNYREGESGTMKERKNLGGRPRREPDPGERVKLGLRVTAELKRRLDAAAEQSGRSQSQEAEFRLERSFDRSDLLAEVLTLTFGERLAGLVLGLGLAMQGAAQMTLLVQSRRVHEDWTSDPAAYRAAESATTSFLDIGRPAGEWSGQGLGNGSSYVRSMVRSLHREDGEARTILDEPLLHADTLVRLLGPIATRMIEELPLKDARQAEFNKKFEASQQRSLAREKKREAAITEETTAIDISLGGLADDTVQMVEDVYKPSSPEELAGLLQKLMSMLTEHISSNSSKQKKAS